MTRCFAFAVLSLLLALAPRLTSAQKSIQGGCAQYSALDFEIGVLDSINGFSHVDVYDVEQGVFLPRKKLGAAEIQDTGCVWIAHVGEPILSPDRVRMEKGVLYKIDIVTDSPAVPSRSFYYQWVDLASGGSGFFNPDVGSNGQGDLLFEITTSGIRAIPARPPYGATNDVDDFFATDDWVLPYDVPTICAQASRNPEDYSNYMVLAPAGTVGTTPSLPLAITASQNADWRVRPGESLTWSSSDVSSIDFNSGKLTVEGDFTASGVTFTAAAAAGAASASSPEPLACSPTAPSRRSPAGSLGTLSA